jgi:hypothetical protein
MLFPYRGRVLYDDHDSLREPWELRGRHTARPAGAALLLRHGLTGCGLALNTDTS